jgi:hypothetical protein
MPGAQDSLRGSPQISLEKLFDLGVVDGLAIQDKQRFGSDYFYLSIRHSCDFCGIYELFEKRHTIPPVLG